ncbi:DUF6875 domain-containing protein [Nocardia africana]|uniref:DUF6875 domain-containing protein n=1 Tax=Nocardia africana TaxID=134964 RepID=A0ABW6NN74_9NOCA
MGYSLSEPSEAVSAEIDKWLQGYIGQPHEELGREGPVCPFVLPSLRSGSLSVRVHRWRGSDGVEAMLGLIDRIVAEFARGARGPQLPRLQALVVVVTGLNESAWWLIDEGHRRAKGAVVDRGYMLGQFHPHCAEPAAHNPLFPVNRAPYPLFAIRKMALHDLLFLHDDPVWFDRYQERFAHKFTDGTHVDEYLRDLFRATTDRYSPSEGIMP